jgi:hypothetical protein
VIEEIGFDMNQETEFAIREFLQSLGWLPTELDCREKERLAEAYADATMAWFEASKGLRLTLFELLRQSYLASRQREFEILKPLIESARVKAARARLDLAVHIAEHKC